MPRWVQPSSGESLAYDDQGSGSVVLWLHAFPLCRAMWARQLQSLSQVARVIAVDLPGFGKSSLPAKGWTVDGVADTLVEFLSGIGVEQPVVVGGLSMGGYVALALARRHPTRLTGLILADTRAEADTPEARQNRDRMITLAQTEGVAAVFSVMQPKLLAPHTLERHSALVSEITTMAEAQTVPAIVAALTALRDRPDATATLSAIRVPTLVIVGEQDQLTPPAVAKTLADAIPGAQLAILPEAGHLSNLEVPEAFNRHVQDFLGSFVGNAIVSSSM